MSLEKLNKAADNIRFYDRMLADIELAMKSERPSSYLEKKHKRYKQYKATYEKKYREALSMLEKSNSKS